MHWRDEALILGGRRFGESGLILDVLTATRGRQSGLVHGGGGRKRRGAFEPGNTADVAWAGRLEEQLGRFETAEISESRAARHLDSANSLAAISAVTTILRNALNEGDSAGSALFGPTTLLLDALETWAIWPALYARWELGLLSTLGFGLDLESCALSGANDGLTHVSPSSGRAVRGSQAGQYLGRLLRLPGFLIDDGAMVTGHDIADSLALTGHFLERRLFAASNKGIPEARTRLVNRLSADS